MQTMQAFSEIPPRTAGGVSAKKRALQVGIFTQNQLASAGLSLDVRLNNGKGHHPMPIVGWLNAVVMARLQGNSNHAKKWEDGNCREESTLSVLR